MHTAGFIIVKALAEAVILYVEFRKHGMNKARMVMNTI